MINVFPEIYEDETVYSWFCRYLISNNIFTQKEIANELFKNENDIISKLFVGNVNDDAKKNIEKTLPISKLLYHHTMFYAYTGYCKKSYNKQLLAKLIESPYNTEMYLKRQKNQDIYLRYCPLCIKNDRRKYGEAYWHNIHQLREMIICPIHKCYLINSSVKYYGRDKKQVLFPLEILDTETTIKYETNDLLLQLVLYTSDRFFKQDISEIEINYYLIKKNARKLIYDMIMFYWRHNIHFMRDKMNRMLYDNRKNFFIMSAIYYYVELFFPKL